MLRLAASSPWPILILWGVIALIARAAKKKAQPPQPLARQRDVGSSRVELGDAFQRAMEKLRQAERESVRTPVRVAPRLVLEDHSAQSQESEPEVLDYDDEAEQLEEKRAREASEAFDRIDAPTSRSSPSAAMQPAPAQPRRSPLARFAVGSARGAIVLSEILGRPVSDR